MNSLRHFTRTATARSITISPLANTTAKVTATVGGLPAAVSFAGLTPGLVGLAQANVVVPLTGADGNPLPPGDYPVLLNVGGVTSNSANITVGR